MKNELKRVNSIAQKSRYAYGVNGNTVLYSMGIFRRHIVDGSILELGPAEGVATEILAKHYTDITVVEGATLFCEQLKARYPQIEVVNSLFEDFAPRRKYKNVILGHILEHVEDPTELMKRVAKWVDDDGKIMCAVPNANSLHRQAAVLMGLLKDKHELNETDAYHGHRRVYEIESLKKDFITAGLKIDMIGGYWIKPLSNKQIEETWTNEMIDAFMVLGEQYPEIAAEIYIVASR